MWKVYPIFYPFPSHIYCFCFDASAFVNRHMVWTYKEFLDIQYLAYLKIKNKLYMKSKKQVRYKLRWYIGMCIVNKIAWNISRRFAVVRYFFFIMFFLCWFLYPDVGIKRIGFGINKMMWDDVFFLYIAKGCALSLKKPTYF